MTAICGRVRLGDDASAETFCARALANQRRYGQGQPRISSLGWAHFGIDLFPFLPEDFSDRQPLADDGLLFVADARLDNRDELSDALSMASGFRASLSDGEMLGLAWKTWGADAIERVVGDFAAAAYCHSERRLTLVRDGAGERPLFYCEREGDIFFASMPSALLVDPKNWRGFDLDRLAAMLADATTDDSESYFRGIHRVLPGERLTFDRRGKQSAEIWKPSFRIQRYADPRDHVAAFREVLDRSVKARLRRADGTVSAHLSAGFDSSAVSATAARLLGPGEALDAFTSVPRAPVVGPLPKDSIADESGLAALTAAMHRMNHRLIRSPQRPFDHLASQAATYQQPHRNVLNSGWDLAIRRAAAESGSRVLLTGEFGNLTLTAGGLQILPEMLANGQWLRWAKEARAAVKHSGVRWRGVAYSSFRPWLPATLNDLLRRRFLDVEPLNAGFVKREWLDRVRWRAAQARSGPHSRENVRRFATLRRADPAMVRKGALAETGTDVRDPLADRRVVEFSLTLPPEQQFSNGIAWPLARAALADRVPREIVATRHRGYQSADWHALLVQADVKRMIDEIEASPTARELIDFAELRRCVADWPRADLASARVITRYVARLPTTVAAGYFLLEVERAVAEAAASS